jgi:hypothetical protein
MSLAGIRSNRGDHYQRSVALYWIVNMLTDDNIIGIQVDSVSLPNEDIQVFGDDIVVLQRDGKKIYIQAKVNQPKHQEWRLSDTTLRKELCAAKKQLLQDNDCEFHLYSRTPFGELHRLVEEINLYPDYPAFVRESANNHKKTLNNLTNLWTPDNSDFNDSSAFELTRRLSIGSSNSSENWIDLSQKILRSQFSKPTLVADLLWTYIDNQHSKLDLPQYIINRSAVIDWLKPRGIYHSLDFNEQKLLDSFNQFSSNGRQWVRTIGDTVIPRTVVSEVEQEIQSRTPSILLEDVAGGGKTCILLDLMDRLEQRKNIATLFIRGDLYSSITSLSQLSQYGLPNNLVAQCARLAERRSVVIIIDSLDVLAVGRSHHALACFLGFISDLSNINNITVVAASRSFDAQYDPQLRAFHWAKTLPIAPLSYINDVTPLLAIWEIDPESIKDELKTLLIIPQNLRLFHSLVEQHFDITKIHGHDLHDVYIRECIENDDLLGVDVIEALYSISETLMENRCYQFSYSRLKLEEKKIKRLLSCEILTKGNGQELMFSHQTLADTLRIQKAQKDNINLCQFILSQPQLPFLRSTIRTYIQSLRSGDAKAFTRQLNQLIQHQKVTSHIKRLAIESLASMTPTPSDASLMMKISTCSPVLFSRFLEKANSPQWFLFLHNNWLDKVDVIEFKKQVNEFIHYSIKFKNQYPELLIALCNKVINEGWTDNKSGSWFINRLFNDFTSMDLTGIKELLTHALNNCDNHSFGLGKAISLFVEQTNSGDDLLWQYITRDAVPVSESEMSDEIKLNCNTHDLHSDSVLENRLKFSDKLFDDTVVYLKSFIEEQEDFSTSKHYFRNLNLLDHTSHRLIHRSSSFKSYDAIHTLTEAFESALKYRAKISCATWKKLETNFRDSPDHGIRYLLLLGYKVNPANNINGILFQLLDANLLRYGKLDYELGQLSAIAYPYISAEYHEKHQALIMQLYDEEEAHPSIDKIKYRYLQWLPACYRSREVDFFFTDCQKKYGSYPPEPDVGVRGGIVRSPVSANILLALSPASLIRLLAHYNNHNHWDSSGEDYLTGGREQLSNELSTAASLAPDQYLSTISSLDKAQLADEYIFAILDGVSNHLRYRFGNLSSSNWSPVDPLPDGNALALQLLTSLETYTCRDERGYSTIRAVQACCEVLNDENSIRRLIIQLNKLSTHKNPRVEEDVDAESLIGRGINSVRGQAADSVLILCNKHLTQEKELTDDQCQLLELYAKDPSIVVRATFLRRLPYLLSMKPKLGWHLIDLIMQDENDRLWKHLEECVYYNYHDHFDQVRPFIEKLKNINDDKSAEAWGRLSALSYLSEKVTEQDFFASLSEIKIEKCCFGAARVFTNNIKDTKSTERCLRGISHLLSLNISDFTYLNLTSCLDDKQARRMVPSSLIRQFIDSAPAESIRDLDRLFSWMADRVSSNPELVLELLELKKEKLNQLKEPFYIHRPEDLLVTLRQLLKEADMIDDEDLIERVLTVQNWFIEYGVKEVEALLEEA